MWGKVGSLVSRYDSCWAFLKGRVERERDEDENENTKGNKVPLYQGKRTTSTTSKHVHLFLPARPWQTPSSPATLISFPHSDPT